MVARKQPAGERGTKVPRGASRESQHSQRPAPRYTDEQRRALEARDVSVALSAGAGCGKTFVLTQRFLSHFDPRHPDALRPDQIGRLVAITFTNAAAREMRDRVRRTCYERLMSCPDSEQAHWSAMIRSLDAARISTIDSFCATLLRTHAVEAGLDPRFTALDAAQSGSLLSELTDDVLRAALSAHEDVALHLVEKFGLEALSEMLQLLAAHRDADDLARWQELPAADLVERWSEFHRTQVVPAVMRRVVESEPARQLREFLEECAPTDPVVEAQRATILAILAAWENGTTHSGQPADDLAELRDNAKIIKRSPKSWPTPDDYNTFRDDCQALRADVIDKRKRDLAFDPAAAQPAAQAALHVLGLALRVLGCYTRAKQEAATLDFHDMLSRARALLRSPEHAAVRRRLAEQIELLLVDEFQDTDQVQVDLIETLCGGALDGGKLFFVGDHKQSIYRFRGADPRVFHTLRERIPDAGKLPLTLNFRSQPAILKFVNALFDGELGAHYEPLAAHRSQVAPEPSVEFLWALPDVAAGDGVHGVAHSNGQDHGDNGSAAPDSNAAESRDDVRRREADWIARRLRNLVDGGEPIVWDAKAPPDAPRARAVRPGDIAILFRALSDVWLYEDALRKYGLDYYLVGGHAFYSQQEIFDVANLLRAVAHPDDVISLAGALRSPFFCLTDETLFWLGQHREGLSAGLFADRLPEELDGQQQRRARFAADTLRALRQQKDSTSIAELVEEALSRTGYDALLLAEFLGERKLANLRKLIDQARGFQRGGMFHLADFIVELSGRVAEQPKEALAATNAADTDVVRLMSIHQAKGLEFPVVVVADLDRQMQPRSAAAEFSRQLGPLVRMPARSRDAVGGYELFQSIAAVEDLAEMQRLLYVAATRAADHLIFSAGLPALDKLRGPWMRLVDKKFDLETGAWRGAPLAPDKLPRIRVIRAEPVCRPISQRAARPRWQQIVEKAARAAGGGTTGRFRLVDPVPAAVDDRQEFSFSRLTGGMHARRRAAEPMAADEMGETIDAESESIDPLGLGTLVHAVLAEIRGGEPADVADLVQRHADAHVGASGTERQVARELIERFLNSDRARHLAAAKTDYAELEFLLSWPRRSGIRENSVNPGAVPPALRLTGFIDRLYEDAAGQWHVLDFKTNRVDRGKLASVAAGYEMQMLVYALAAEQVLGRPPQSLTLHFLRTGDEYPFPWNDAARQRVRQLVDEALDRFQQPEA